MEPKQASAELAGLAGRVFSGEVVRQQFPRPTDAHDRVLGTELAGGISRARIYDGAPPGEPAEVLAAKVTRLTEKLTKLKEEMGKLAAYEKQMLASPDQQISLTDPDSRSMATSGRGSGVVGYNVQVAVDTEHHLIVTHEVTNSGSDRAQLANMAKQAKAILKT